jgi:hypothetical protein
VDAADDEHLPRGARVAELERDDRPSGERPADDVSVERGLRSACSEERAGERTQGDEPQHRLNVYPKPLIGT